jgi:hypothetical protein
MISAEQTLFAMKKTGEKLKVDECVEGYKVTFWHGEGDGVITHSAKDPDLFKAISKAGEEAAIFRLHAKLKSEGVFDKRKGE